MPEIQVFGTKYSDITDVTENIKYKKLNTNSLEGIKFNELLIIVQVDDSNIQFSIPQNDLSLAAKKYVAGSYWTDDITLGVTISVSISTVNILWVYVNGTPLSNQHMSIYYR